MVQHPSIKTTNHRLLMRVNTVAEEPQSEEPQSEEPQSEEPQSFCQMRTFFWKIN